MADPIPASSAYVICTIARSGSTLLSDGLELTGVAGKPREYFSAPYAANYDERFKGKFEGPDYFSRVCQAAATPNGTVGVKVLRHMFPFMIECAREHAPNGPKKPAALLSSLLPNLRYIWIQRRDVAARAVSQMIAEQTDIWHAYKGKRKTETDSVPEPVYDYDRICAAIRNGYTWDADWAAFFKENRIKPFVLFYEDFVARYEDTLREVLDFLGLSADAPIREPRLQKQADARSEEWIAKFREMAESRGFALDDKTPVREPVSAALPHNASAAAEPTPRMEEGQSAPSAPVPPEPVARPVRVRTGKRIVNRSYLVCTGNRSGSTLLCGGLWRTRIAGNPTEHFAIKHRQLQEDKFKEQGIAGPDFFSRVLQAGTTPNGVFGSKVQRMQYPHLMNAVEEHMPDTGLPPPELLARTLPDLRYIWLWRRDSLARGISAVKAAETGVWHRQEGEETTREPAALPEFDFERIRRAIRIHNRFDREWRRFFAENRIQPLEIVYEDFIADYDGTLRSILRFLDLPDDIEIPPPQLAKLADDVSAQWTERFLAIAKEQGVDPDESSVARMRPLKPRIARIEFTPPATRPLSTVTVPRPPIGTPHMTEPSAPATAEPRKENGAAAPSLTPLQQRLHEAATLHQQGKLADAERICQSVLQQEPENPDALHHMGLLRLQQGKPEEAIGYIEHSLMKVPTQPAAFNHLAIALSALRRHELALASFSKALALKPDYAEAHNNIGAVLRTVGRNDEALVHYAQALSLKPDYLDAHYNCAVILQLLNRHGEAQVHLERVLAGRPDHADAHFHLGISLTALNQRMKAIEHLQRAMALRPEAPAAQPAAQAS